MPSLTRELKQILRDASVTEDFEKWCNKEDVKLRTIKQFAKAASDEQNVQTRIIADAKAAEKKCAPTLGDEAAIIDAWERCRDLLKRTDASTADDVLDDGKPLSKEAHKSLRKAWHEWHHF